jgi:hypothetical protein
VCVQGLFLYPGTEPVAEVFERKHCCTIRGFGYFENTKEVQFKPKWILLIGFSWKLTRACYAQ